MVIPTHQLCRDFQDGLWEEGHYDWLILSRSKV